MYKNEMMDDAVSWCSHKGVLPPGTDFETVHFGAAAQSSKPQPKAKSTTATAISKVKRGKKAAGKVRPTVMVEAIIDVSDSPFVLDTSNPFAALEEPDSPMPAQKMAATPKAEPAEREDASSQAKPSQSRQETPIARRTRTARAALGKAVSNVIAAVSPKVMQTKVSAIIKGGKPALAAAARSTRVSSTRASGLRTVNAAAVN